MRSGARWAVGLGALGVLALGLVVWWRSRPVPVPPHAAKNLVFVVIDTQRTDAMSLYGHPRSTTPRLDTWSKQAVVFDNAWAQGAYTLSSFVSYMSSTHVRSHGLDGNMPDAGMCGWSDLRLLPEVLAQRGFDRVAWVSNSNLYPKKGVSRGFRVWNDVPLSEMVGRDVAKRMVRVSDKRVIKEAIAEVEGWDDGRHFLYAHILGPHLPLRPSKAAREALGVPPTDRRLVDIGTIRKWRKEVSPAQMRTSRRLYHAATWDADRRVGELLDVLDQRDDTVVVVFSDHGEQLWEHGSYGHEDGVWEQLVHVPLVVKAPGLEPGRQPAPVMLVDLLPTALRLLGVDARHDGWVGEDLFAARPDRVVVSQRFHEMSLQATVGGAPRKAIWWWEEEPARTAEADRWSRPGKRQRLREESREQGRLDGWKVYDVAADPYEQEPLSDERSEVDALRSRYGMWLDRAPAQLRPDEGEDASVGICSRLGADEQGLVNEALEVLGYME